MCSSATTGCEENIICKQCHAMLVAHTIKNCIVCKCKSIQKYMVLFNINKYPSHKDIIDNKLIPGECKLYICRKCHNESQLKFQCICCCRCDNKSVCTEYVPNNHDFQKYIVSHSLNNINSDFQGNRYICLQCHNKLI